MTAVPAPAGEEIPAGVLLEVARRLDSGRDFLLVSRVLGKHIPVDPAVCLAAGAALALRLAPPPDPRRGLVAASLTDAAAARALWEEMRRAPVRDLGRVAVIGFAETATGLGHAVADCLAGASYHQTTRRRQAPGPPPIAVDERHSHAREQWLWSVPDACDLLVVVDDELTTGRTAQALMEAVHPRAGFAEVAMLALCDGISPDRRRHLHAAAARLGARLGVHSLHTLGSLPAAPDVGERRARPAAAGGSVHAALHVRARGPVTGRRRAADPGAVTALAKAAAAAIRSRLPHRGLHVLGTGELMHLPTRVAALLPGATVSATTRSPISVCDLAGYPVRSGIAFAATDGGERLEYAYNLDPLAIEQLVVIADDPPELLTPLVEAVRSAGLPEPLVLVIDGADG